MTKSTHQATDGTLLWADDEGWVYAQQTNQSNGLTYQSFVTAAEATEEDENDCNTIILTSLPHINDYQLIP